MALKKNNTQFLREVYKQVKNEYTFLERYINSRTKILVRHNTCEYEFLVNPHNFLDGKQTRCPKCSGKMKKTDKEFIKEVFDLVGNEYTFLDEYITNNKKIRVKHNKCGYIYNVKPNDFQQGRRCPNCTVNKEKTDSIFKEEIFNLVKSEYEFLEPYIKSNLKIRVRHNKCNYIYSVTPSDFLNGHRCPKCKESKGERAIDSYLHLNKIKHTHQKKFKSCKYKRHLSFDFLIKYDDVLILIEYDGKQHFQPHYLSKNDNEFKETQKRDKIKNNWATKKHIHLLRISYKHLKNISKILDDYLKNVQRLSKPQLIIIY